MSGPIPICSRSIRRLFLEYANDIVERSENLFVRPLEFPGIETTVTQEYWNVRASVRNFWHYLGRVRELTRRLDGEDNEDSNDVRIEREKEVLKLVAKLFIHGEIIRVYAIEAMEHCTAALKLAIRYVGRVSYDENIYPDFSPHPDILPQAQALLQLFFARIMVLCRSDDQDEKEEARDAIGEIGLVLFMANMKVAPRPDIGFAAIVLRTSIGLMASGIARNAELYGELASLCWSVAGDAPENDVELLRKALVWSPEADPVTEGTQWLYKGLAYEGIDAFSVWILCDAAFEKRGAIGRDVASAICRQSLEMLLTRLMDDEEFGNMELEIVGLLERLEED